MDQRKITQKPIPKFEKPTQKSIQKIIYYKSRSTIHKIFIPIKKTLTLPERAPRSFIFLTG